MGLTASLFVIAMLLGLAGMSSRDPTTGFSLMLTAIAVVAVAGVAVLRKGNKAQRIVICLGLLAAAAQVLFPPTAKHDDSKKDRPVVSTTRRFLNHEHTYHQSIDGEWIDVPRQTIGLLGTAAVTLMVAGLLRNCSGKTQITG